MSKKVLDTNNKQSHLMAQAFFDPSGGTTIQRYDQVKHKIFQKYSDQTEGFFWRPQEVALDSDAKDYRGMSEKQKYIFRYTVARKIILDSVQGKAPALAFLPAVSLPELERWIVAWTFSETIHSSTYTWILRNVFPDPSEFFDELLNIRELVECANNIGIYYDKFIEMTAWYNLLGEGEHVVNDEKIIVDRYALKKALWLCIMSVNVLEGVRFYASFTIIFNQVEAYKRLNGSASLIKLIARDENIHLASTQTLLKILPKDDPDFKKIAEETRDECIGIFRQAAEQEKSWAEFIFKEDSMLGVSEELLCQYVEFITNKRMTAVGLPKLFKVVENPFPWMTKWISGAEVQVANQEHESTMYNSNQTLQDVKDDTFKGFEL